MHQDLYKFVHTASSCSRGQVLTLFSIMYRNACHMYDQDSQSALPFSAVFLKFSQDQFLMHGVAAWLLACRHRQLSSPTRLSYTTKQGNTFSGAAHAVLWDGDACVTG